MRPLHPSPVWTNYARRTAQQTAVIPPGSEEQRLSNIGLGCKVHVQAGRALTAEGRRLKRLKEQEARHA
jgi:hypothetical protein